MAKHAQELSFYRKEVEKLKLENKRLQNFKQTEEEQLCDTIDKVEKMQSGYESIKQWQINQRHTALMKMDCLRSIKEATQTYINIEALPQMIQGVTIYDRVTTCEWRPFCFDPSKHTQREISDKIWHDSQINSIHRETWEKLILSDIVNLKPSDTEVSKANVTQII
ncbi:hypothetical protein DOY81_014768 [Sarcophaga bullata]|nr:hypothetical protein DOY81_014768 [Sarcophaga bullata]